MVKNKKIKIILKHTIFLLLTLINKFILKKNIILIYANSKGLRDNSKYLYDSLIRLKVNSKYKIYIAVNKEFICKTNIANVKYVSIINGIFKYMNSKYVFYCFGQIPIKPARHQSVIHLTHGLAFKKDGLLIKANKNVGKICYFNKVLTSSEFYKNIYSKIWGCNESDIIFNSFPRNDALYPSKHYDGNVIFWCPTFRHSTYLGMNDSNATKIIPIFDDFDELNDLSKKYDVKIVVKLHPMENLKDYKLIKLSNLEVYSDSDFRKEKGELYEFMNFTSAMISDYSSVFLDYLILNRPIALTNDDMSSYKENRGLLFEKNELFNNSLDMINNKHDFEEFLSKYRIDERKNARELLNNIINPYFIEEKNCESLLKLLGVLE